MKKSVVNPERSEFDELVKKQIVSRFKLKAKTEGQQEFINAIEDCSIVLCSGCAGVGKTFCAMAKGIELLRDGKVDRVILVRPLQECGRQLGYFPGDKDEKIANHMLAFTELFSSMLSKDEIEKYMQEGKLVLESIEFLRGLTFKNTYLVIDEAQNCTYQQLKMMLTRIGEGSKIVVVGDTTQTDLPEKFWAKSGSYSRIPLALVMDKLFDIDEDIDIVKLTEDDIVRHGLIAKLCRAL